MSCLFCRIVRGEIPATRVLETEGALAFRDIHPGAPTHVLVVPKEHLDGVAATDATHQSLLGEIVGLARDVAKAEGLAKGYRLVINQGQDAGQSVGHLHMHVLGGRSLGWPPG